MRLAQARSPRMEEISLYYSNALLAFANQVLQARLHLSLLLILELNLFCLTCSQLVPRTAVTAKQITSMHICTEALQS